VADHGSQDSVRSEDRGVNPDSVGNLEHSYNKLPHQDSRDKKKTLSKVVRDDELPL
jgi:hypothetical protein